jgi:O-antigen ligase
MWRRIKEISSQAVLCGFVVAALGSVYAPSVSAPIFLRSIALEIQAACRDAGTQWMVVACLVSYFITFLVLGRPRIQSHSTLNVQPSTSAAPSRHLSLVPRHVFSNPDLWLCAFVVLVGLRYAVDYPNAARSLQVVVLLAGIVVGKGIALWAAWPASRKSDVSRQKSGEEHPTSNAQHPTSEETEARHLTQNPHPQPLSQPPGEGGVGLSPIEAEREPVPSSIFDLRSSSRRLIILSIITALLAVAALWHPERGMEYFYRGQQRWTGPWDNPNLYGVLMGVGVALAVGLLASGIWRRAETPTCNLQPSTCNFLRRFSSRVTRHASHLLLLVAAALCAFGLLKSYSRGAWLGTACGLGFLVWQWSNREPHEIREKRGQEKPATFNFQPATFLSLLSRLWRISRLATWVRRNGFPISVLLISAFVLCFWQFRHTESPLLRRVFSVGNVNDFSWRNRVAAWRGAGRMMLAKPISGFGWGTAEEIYSKEYRAARLEETAAIQMNDYLMIGISAGVPALGCLFIYLWLAMSRGKMGIRHHNQSPHPQPLSQPLGEGGAGLSPFVAERVPELSTINSQPSTTGAITSLPTICFAGAIVGMIGFWFDGGFFKLPTAVVFWVLVELCRRRGGEEECLTTMAAGGESVRASRLVSSLAPPIPGGAPGLTRPTIVLRWLAGIVALVAVAITVLHLLTPQLAVSERTLSIARKFLVPHQEKTDFEFLAAKPIWGGRPLQVLLQHVHLANYNRTLVNWKLDDQLYREFVLSPEIGRGERSTSKVTESRHLAPVEAERESAPATLNPQPSTGLNWRRPLWEFYYPRIRKETSLAAAAEIVLRQWRENGELAGREAGPETLAEIWKLGRADQPGFEFVAVAALRSVGIPARRSPSGPAEFWTGLEWKVIPPPVAAASQAP